MQLPDISVWVLYNADIVQARLIFHSNECVLLLYLLETHSTGGDTYCQAELNRSVSMPINGFRHTDRKEPRCQASRLSNDRADLLFSNRLLAEVIGLVQNLSQQFFLPAGRV